MRARVSIPRSTKDFPQVIRKATDETERAMKASSGRLPTMRGITSFGVGSGSITSCSHLR